MLQTMFGPPDPSFDGCRYRSAAGKYRMVKMRLTPQTSVHIGQRMFWKNYVEGEVTPEENGNFAGYALEDVTARTKPNWLMRLLHIPGRRTYATMSFWLERAGRPE